MKQDIESDCTSKTIATCISCQKQHSHNFCPNCGEKSGVKKITLKSILSDSFSTVSNMDKGFLYNVKFLTKRPQKGISDYLLGKRKDLLSPIAFLIISITVYLFVIKFNQSVRKNIRPVDVSEARAFGARLGAILIEYLKYFWVIIVFNFGLSTKIFFIKRHNYLEHVAINSFIFAHATLAGIIAFLIFKNGAISSLTIFVVLFFQLVRVFRKKNEIIKPIITTIACFIFSFIQVTIIFWILAYVADPMKFSNLFNG